MSEKFDAIVVGAGIGGLAAAYKMAEAGLSVAVIERGDYPGAKNVMGGVLYRTMMEELIPEFWKEAPLQRPVVEQKFWLLDEHSVVTTGHKNQAWAKEPYNCFTVFRGEFDRWFAQKCEEAGALLINETLVESCIMEGNRVVGVRTGRPDGDLYADVVILADGVNSLLAEQLGFHRAWTPGQLALSVMEMWELPAQVIEERFNLEPGMGATVEIYGDGSCGLVGTAFIYTNKAHLSIGVGALLSQIVEAKARPYEMLEYLKQHPLVNPLIKDGKPVEYYAHLIPEGGYYAVPQLSGDGVVVVGDAAQLVNGLHREGCNLAMTSGRLAAEAIVLAHQKGDFTARQLAHYDKCLKESFVLRDLQKYKHATHLMAGNPRYLNDYIPFANHAMQEMLTVDGLSKKEKQKKIMQSIFNGRSLLTVGWDVFRLWRALW